MTVKRVMGTETEYAVSLNTPDRYNPVQLSFDVVNGAADSHSKSIRWDYRQEDPVNDARGTRLERAAARPDMLTDAPQLNITNVIAPNGGRVYVDHAHPEYSAPETTDPFEAARYDRAGDLIMQAATERARTQTGAPIALHRNNVDGKGSCWGAHENYMMARSVPFDLVTRLMTLHFVTRQIYAGSGQRYWYIGKIDGVINYVRHMSEWTVTAALFEFGPDNEPKPIIGIVHAPALGLTYLAARGAGAVRIHKTTVGEKRDKVVPSMTSSLDGSVLGYGMSFLPGESQRALDVASSLAGRPADIKRVGPASLDLCKVADGTYDAYFEPMLHVWDIPAIAAGTVVVWEAQGTLSRWDGERIHWRHDNDVVASNGLIIRELQHYLHQYPWPDSINQR